MGIVIEVDDAGILYLSPAPEHFWYRTGSPYSVTGLVPASAFLFIPVPDWLYAGLSDTPAFKKGVHPARHTSGCENEYTLHVHAVVGGK